MFFWFQAWNHSEQFFIGSRGPEQPSPWTLEAWNQRPETTRLRAVNGAVPCLTFGGIIVELDERISTLQKSRESELVWARNRGWGVARAETSFSVIGRGCSHAKVLCSLMRRWKCSKSTMFPRGDAHTK